MDEINFDVWNISKALFVFIYSDYVFRGDFTDFGVSCLFKEITCTHSRGHKITNFGRRDFNKKLGVVERDSIYCKNNLFLKKKTKMTKKSNFEILG